MPFYTYLLSFFSVVKSTHYLPLALVSSTLAQLVHRYINPEWHLLKNSCLSASSQERTMCAETRGCAEGEEWWGGGLMEGSGASQNPGHCQQQAAVGINTMDNSMPAHVTTVPFLHKLSTLFLFPSWLPWRSWCYICSSLTSAPGALICAAFPFASDEESFKECSKRVHLPL